MCAAIRTIVTTAALTVVALAAGGLIGAAPAAAAPAPSGGLAMTVDATDPLAPTVTLRNDTGADCQVATTALGTIGLTYASQAGHRITAIATDPSFPEALDVVIAGSLRTLAPGASQTIKLTAAPAGPTGPAIQTVTWGATASLGALYPVRGSGALDLTATYAVPAMQVTGAPLCPPAAAGSVDAKVGAGPAKSGGGLPIIAIVVGAVLLAVVVAGVALVAKRVHKNAMRGAAVALLLAAALSTPFWSARPAAASIVVDPGLTGAFGQCGSIFNGAGGDPANILPTLNDPNNHVQIVPALPGDTHEIKVGNQIIIFWDPNDRHKYSGQGGNADPCTSLYHEMYHGNEDLHGGQDHSNCVTAASGDSGLPVNEVNATRAQNQLRAKLGLPERTHYGDTKLPDGPCLPKDKHPPPKKNCSGAGCGDSNGDPHMITFDGGRYDFQAIGEFVGARDTADPGFQVQLREQPMPNATSVAVNTAVAMAVAGDRVEVDVRPDGMVLVVNGHPAPLASTSLDHGGSVTLDATTIPAQIVVQWPDGSQAFVVNIAHYGLHVTIHPAAAHAGKLVGLLGNFDGTAGNDLKTSAGKAVPVHPEFGDLYPSFADSWRITDRTSLFTYPQGTSTATYTDRSLPTPPPALADLPGADAAAALCHRVGITDPQLLADCTLDVAETGQALFATGDLASQGIAALPHAPTPGPTTSQAIGNTQRATLTVTKPNGSDKLTFPGVAGQRLFVDFTAPGQHGCGVLDLFKPDGGTLDIGCADPTGHGTIGGDLLKTTGTYSLVFSPLDHGTGQLQAQLTFSTDVHTTLPTDGSPVTVSITTPGQVAYLAFPAQLGDRVLVRADDSTLPNGCGLPNLADPTGGTINLGCTGQQHSGLIDATLLKASGTYAVVVDPEAGATGQITLRLIVSRDQHGTVIVNGPPVTATISKPGQVSEWSFTGSKGQQVSIVVTASTVTPGCGLILLRTPDGTAFDEGCVGQDHTGSFDTTLPEGGTFAVDVDLPNLDTGSVTFAVSTG